MIEEEIEKAFIKWVKDFKADFSSMTKSEKIVLSGTFIEAYKVGYKKALSL